MSFIRKNQYDESMKALLRATESRTPRAALSKVTVGASADAPFPVGMFAAIVAAGILGGAAATYFERQGHQR